MNFRYIGLILGAILALEGMLMGTCWLYAWLSPLDRETAMEHSWAVATCVTFTTGVLLVALCRREISSQIMRREAMAVIGLTWIVSGLFASIPFMMEPLNMMPWDALFESYSGLTTTGATVMSNLNEKPHSIILWRSMMQWIGGLGIIILFVAVLGLFNAGGKSLFTSESSAVAESESVARIKALSIGYLTLYLAFTVIGLLGMVLSGSETFEALNLAMCGIATGGFSPVDESAGHLPEISQMFLIFLMVSGGIAFPVHYQLWILRRLEVVKTNTELHVYGAILFVATAIIAVDLIWVGQYRTGDYHWIIVDSLFQVTSIMTTSGFSSADFNAWPPLAKVILLGLMIIGGCAGSTSCGLKVARVVVFFKAMLRQIRQAFRPHRVFKLNMNGRPLSEKIIAGVIFYVALNFFMVLIGVFGLAIMQPQVNMATIISAVLACINNIGPGLELVGPSENYAFLRPISKLWLSLLMLLGRIEFFAVLVLFFPSFWKKF
ncbi:MAG: TrkH family potassium uptake protein [Verrucomicrobiota bacterium]